MKRVKLLALLLSVFMFVAYMPAFGMPAYADADNTAQIGDTQYPSLAEAVEAAEDGDTIQMIADEDLAGSVTINKSLTVDLNGKTISRNTTTGDGYVLIVNEPDASVTVKDSSDEKNGNIICNYPNSIGIGIDVRKGTVILDSGNVKSNLLGIENGTDGKTIINGGTVTGSAAIRSFGILEVNGGSVYGESNSSPNGLYLRTGSKTSITGGEIKSSGVAVEISESNNGVNASLEITGGEIISTSQWSSGRSLVSRGGNIITITDGLFICTYPRSDRDSELFFQNGEVVNISGGRFGKFPDHNSQNNITITGGYFANDVSAYIEMPYMCVRDETFERFGYRVAKMAAEVQNVDEEPAYFESFSDAVSAAGQGNVIKLLADYEGTYKMTSGQTLVVDKNGFIFNEPTSDSGYIVRCTNAGTVYTYTLEKTPVKETVVNEQTIKSEIKDLPVVKISKPKAGKKKVTVKWKKISKKNVRIIQGVEIQIATDKGFRNIVKTTTASKKKTSKVVKKLRSKTKYYVRIRAYRNAADGKHVSAWKTKTVKIK